MSTDHAGNGHTHNEHTPPAAGSNGHGDAHGHGHGPTHEGHAHHEDDRNILQRYVFSTDHKVIGIQFLFSGLIFFILGGLLAMAIRWQLAWPWTNIPILSQMMEPQWHTGGRMPPEWYNKLF